MSRKYSYDPRHLWSKCPRICGLRCDFCGDLFNDPGKSKVLCRCGLDHLICGDCVKKYATTQKVEGIRWHSVKVCPDDKTGDVYADKVARKLMGIERWPINKEDKW